MWQDFKTSTLEEPRGRSRSRQADISSRARSWSPEPMYEVGRYMDQEKFVADATVCADYFARQFVAPYDAARGYYLGEYSAREAAVYLIPGRKVNVRRNTL